MRFQEGALNKAAIIILNLTSGLSSSQLQRRPPRFAHLRETFRLAPGSINTVGQALAQLSLSTSDSARSKRYDLSLDHSASQLLHQIDRHTLRGTNSRSRRKNIHTRSRFATIPPRAIYSFGRKGRARLPLCLWCAILFSQPSQLRSRGKQPFTSKIDPYCQSIFSREKQRCSQSRLVEVKD
jgi:hypothetical protein